MHKIKLTTLIEIFILLVKSVMSENNYNKIDDLEYHVYLDERKALIDAERESARLFDKAILTLTSGAFGLSLAFIRQIVPSIRCGTKLFLIFGWTGFSLSLLSTLISFLISQFACRKQREILELEYSRDQKQNSQEDKQNIKNKWARCTNRLNISSLVFFILGLIFLAVFVIINL